MKHIRNGLSREQRLSTGASAEMFSVIDNDAVSLLRQAYAIGSFLRYHNLDGVADGYFNELLPDFEDAEKFYSQKLETLQEGNMEPAQALLLIFLENLKRTTQPFNERWKNYPLWYLQDILKVKPLPPAGNKVWLSFGKMPLDKVLAYKGTRFVTHNEQGRALYYKLEEDIELLDTVIERGHILNFEKDNRRIPEGYFDFVTAVRVRDLNIHQNKQQSGKSLKTVGLKLTSPALLLREGERNVKITFTGQKEWDDLLKPAAEVYARMHPGDHDVEDKKALFKAIAEKFAENMFYITISTTEGWENIPDFKVTAEGSGNLVLNFTLPESYSSTTGCTLEKHKFYSRYPKLNLHLNFDAWLYPYSWIKDFVIEKITIETDVRGINDVEVYNELGQLDVSKPFAPFGINNEKGSWFAVGNYEMAIKDTHTVDIDIQWRQLPEDNNGLYGYYKQYGKDITNASFILQSRFLANYSWKETPGKSRYYLFSDGINSNEPIYNAPLAAHTLIKGVDISKMPPVDIEEEEYKYSQKSRAGFVDFILRSPDMGFGEVEYRRLFTEQLMRNARKDQKYPTINPPINPLVGRITLCYKAVDTIDLVNGTVDPDSAVDAILPLDTLTEFPAMRREPLPFVTSMEESNILLALRNVAPGKMLSLFFDFIPSIEEIAENNIPRIQWYIGNMRNWKVMPHSFVHKDETRRLSVNGRIQFILPESIDSSLFDNDGLLWLRGGISITETVIIPTVNAIYINAAPLSLDIDFNDTDAVYFKQINAPLEPEKNIPGVIAYQKISSFYEGREAEDKKDMQVRIAEHITHRGRAVTMRDYERLTLQAFPDIAKVRCYRDYNDHEHTNVNIAVLPYSKSYMPLVSNYVMVKIERYLSKLASAYVNKVKVTNPAYREILVKAVLKYNGEYLSDQRRKQITAGINAIIAPWQDAGLVPDFNYSFRIKQLREVITSDFKAEISIVKFEVLCFGKKEGKYTIHEHEDENTIIVPKEPNIIFVPAKEHIIQIEGVDKEILDDFGINEMELGDTFIIK